MRLVAGLNVGKIGKGLMGYDYTNFWAALLSLAPHLMYDILKRLTSTISLK